MFKKSRKTSFLTIASQLEDYVFFEGDPYYRQDQKERFVIGQIAYPMYDYPRLERLNDLSQKDVSELVGPSHRSYVALEELEKSEGNIPLSPEERKLTVEFHENRLRKMMLVSAANHIRISRSNEEQKIAEEDFTYLNDKIYGPMDVERFRRLLASEKARLDTFVPKNRLDRYIQKSLKSFYRRFPLKKVKAAEVFTPELLKDLHAYVWRRYGKVLRAVPDTGEDVFYDAEESAKIISKALAVGGLAKHGWSCEVEPYKAVPATNSDTKTIYLPPTTLRTADQLRRLIIHEQEVHARTTHNGIKTGIGPLTKGTAGAMHSQEGLGILLECAVSGTWDNSSFDRAMYRYITAGLALGLLDGPMDGRLTFEPLWEMIAVKNNPEGGITEDEQRLAQWEAMTHVENAFRGTSFNRPGVIYRKLKVYYEGLEANALYFNERRHDLEAAFASVLVGKHDHTDENEAGMVKRLLGRSK